MSARDDKDRDLGMGREISRRDFLHGAVGSVVGGAALASGCSPESMNLAAGSVARGAL